MDSSNSQGKVAQDREIVEAALCGLGIKHLTPEDYVMAVEVAPSIDASQLDMADIWGRVLKKIRPTLKYLSFFIPLANFFNCERSSFRQARQTDFSLVRFPSGISERTKVVEVGGSDLEDQMKAEVWRRRYFLTKEGAILVLLAVFKCNEFHQVLIKAELEVFDEKSIHEAMVIARSVACDTGSTLIRNIFSPTDWSKVIIGTLICLSGEFRSCAREREERLRRMQEAADFFHKILGRIRATSK